MKSPIRPRRPTKVALWIGLLLAAGCAPREPAGRLLDGFRPKVSSSAKAPRNKTKASTQVNLRAIGGPRKASALERHRVRLGTSEREAIVTSQFVTWELPLGPLAQTIELAVGTIAAPAAPRPGHALAVVQEAGGDSTVLLDLPISSVKGWTTHRLNVPRGGTKRRLILSCSGWVPIGWSEIFRVGNARSKRPNLVFVIVDTLRADHLSGYGYRRPTSPNLDRFARGALKFRHAYSASTWTLPSTASLLTGLYPDQHGVLRLPQVLPDEALTLAERLRALGYRTTAFTDGGFVDPQWGFAQGFDRYDSTRGQAWAPKDVKRVVDPAVAWLDQNRSAPFFLLVHTYEVHQPYFNREGDADPFLPEGPRPRTEGYAIEFPARLGGSELERAVSLYDGEIHRADRYLQRLWQRLGRLDLLDRTAVLVTADHGEEFMEHGNMEHGLGKVYDENVRVPLILKLPEGSSGTIDVPASGVDIVPTFLDLAGAPKSEIATLPGRSLRSLAAEPQDPAEPREILVEGLSSFHQLHERRYRLDQRGHTLVFDAERRRARLFDRANDPALRSPRLPTGRDGAHVARLELALAWLGGPRAVRLPDESSALAIPRNSRIVPLAVWDGLDQRKLPHQGQPVALTPGRPHALSFALLPGGGEITLRLFHPGQERPEQVRLNEPDGKNPSFGAPFVGPLPALAKILVGLSLNPAGSTKLEDLDEEGLAELRALGYLR